MRVNKPSSTALLIAKSIVFLEGNPLVRDLLRPKMAELSYKLLQSYSPISAAAYRFAGKFKIAQWIARRAEAASVPGMLLHYVLRKLQIEDLILEKISTCPEIRQIVILGGGLDTLGLRLSAVHPELGVFEIDHPATQSLKMQAIEKKYVKMPRGFRLLPADLKLTTVQSVLETDADFSFSEPTIFLSEGVFMYLTLDEVVHNLNILHRFPRNTSFIFTYMSVGPSGQPAFQNQTKAVDRWLRAKGEPFVWGKSPKDLGQFLQEKDFATIASILAGDLRKRYLHDVTFEKLTTAEGENILVVSRIDNMHSAGFIMGG